MTKVKAQPGVNFIVFVIIDIPTREVNQSLSFLQYNIPTRIIFPVVVCDLVYYV